MAQAEQAFDAVIAAPFGRIGVAVAGGACRADPVPLVVPCHRVVGAAGPGGFMGGTHGAEIEIKRRLLEHERG
jgi:methylated-DNA-[protein]-cysteine S-methyltransferase